MTVDEFKAVRDIPGKVVTSDLIFAQTANPDIFRSMIKSNIDGVEFILDATYYDHIPAVVFNFRVAGNGAICRYCVNNTPHRDAKTGLPVRTHKHTPQTDRCFDGHNNLPFADGRTDLSIKSFKDVEAVWKTICREANIRHLGTVRKA